jgi:hypothetical protein
MVEGWWHGTSRGSDTAAPIACYFEHAGTAIRGWGADASGVFSISGGVVHSQGRVAWVSDYFGRRSVRHSGVLLQSHVMRGLCYAQPDDVGGWELRWHSGPTWTPATGQLLGRGLDAWLSGNHVDAARSFLDASSVDALPEVALAAATLSAHTGAFEVARQRLSAARGQAHMAGVFGSDAFVAAVEGAWRWLPGIADSSGFADPLGEEDTRSYSYHPDPNTAVEEMAEISRELWVAGEELSADDLASVHGGDPDLMNSLAWSLYEANNSLEAALAVARLGYERGRSRFLAHTVCALLVRMGRWDEARPLFAEWMFGLGRSQKELQARWSLSFRPTFLDVVAHGKAQDAAELLIELGDPIPWLRLELERAAQGEAVTLAWPGPEGE